MTEATGFKSETKKTWIGVLSFINRQAADVVKFLTIIGALWILSYVFHLMKLNGVMLESRIELLETLDFAGNMSIAAMLVCDLVLKAFIEAFGGYFEKPNR